MTLSFGAAAALFPLPAHAAVVVVSGSATIFDAQGTLTTIGDSVDPLGLTLNLSVTLDTDVSGWLDLLDGIDPNTSVADFHYSYIDDQGGTLTSTVSVTDGTGAAVPSADPVTGITSIRRAPDSVSRADLDGIGAPYDTYPDGDYSLLSLGGYAGSAATQDPVTGEFTQDEASLEFRFDIYRPVSGGEPTLGGGLSNVESWFQGQTVVILTVEEDDGENGIVGSLSGIVAPGAVFVQSPVAPVPVPGSVAMMLFGIAGLFVIRRKA